MSDLRRWSEEGATAEEISLLEVSRRERAPSHARSRTLRALGVGAAMTTAATTTTTAATAVAATTGGLSALTKILAISLLGGAVAGGLFVRRSHHAVAPSGAASVAQTTAEPTNVELPKAEPPPAPAAASIAPVPVGVRKLQPAYTVDRLPREVSALEIAHRALTAHNPDAALRQLDRYREQFPAGALASEETVLRVQALLARGDGATAQSLADAYSAAHPDSPYSRRLQELVRAKP